jgi:hypothetical protein
MLLEKGADVNEKSNDGDTALMVASTEGHTEIMKLLLRHGATIPRHLERQQDKKNVAMVMREKPVERPFGKQRMPPEMEDEVMKWLGGKRKTRKSKKSKKQRKPKRK